MTPDPYAAPRADLVPPPPPPPGQSGGPWEIGETLSASWRAFGAAWVPLVFAPLLVGFLFLIPVGITMGLFIAPHMGNPRELAEAMQDPNLYAVMLGWNVVQVVVYSFFQVGFVKMRIAAVRGEQVTFGQLFSGGSRFGAMLGMQAIVGAPGLLVTAIGVVGRYAGITALVMIADWFPYLIGFALMLLSALGLALAEYYLVDRNEGPIQAMRSSFTAPSGERGKVFAYFVVVGLIAIAGLFCCGIPVLVTFPYSGVCCAMLYTKLLR